MDTTGIPTSGGGKAEGVKPLSDEGFNKLVKRLRDVAADLLDEGEAFASEDIGFLITDAQTVRAALAACQAERNWLSESATALAKRNGRLQTVADWANKCLPHIPPAKETTELAKALAALDGGSATGEKA